MPTAPTGGEPSKRDPSLTDEERAARRSENRTTRLEIPAVDARPANPPELAQDPARQEESDPPR